MKKIVAVLGILGVAFLFAYAMLSQEVKTNDDFLDVINPAEISDKSLVDSSLINRGYGHRIGDFKLIDQYGDSISEAIIKNKVYVVDYFFTACGSICPIMSNQLTRVQKAFLGDTNLLILSHTVWPENDTVEKLAHYAKKYHAIRGKWYFLTGNKDSLYALARKSYFVLKPAEAANAGDGNSDFIHTNNFVLIDQKRRIRGYYDGTDSTDVNRLIKDARTLLKK